MVAAMGAPTAGTLPSPEWTLIHKKPAGLNKLIFLKLKRNLQQYGFWATAKKTFYLLLNRFVHFSIFRVVTLSPDDLIKSDVKANPNYHYNFLDREKMIEYAGDPELDWDEKFIEEAVRSEAECFSIMDGDTIASYGWYSRRETSLTDGLKFNFAQGYIYTFKGFTKKNYRGQRLHAVGKECALKLFASRGFKGFISLIEEINYDCQKSIYRMGYKNVGRITMIKLGKRYFISRLQGPDKYKYQITGPQSRSHPLRHPSGSRHADAVCFQGDGALLKK